MSNLMINNLFSAWGKDSNFFNSISDTNSI